jgi:DNA-binding LytR/AlgR family response regulator
MNYKEFIVLTVARNRRRKFFIDQIIYLQADNSYTKIKMNDGQSFLISKLLTEIEQLLCKSTFYRVNRGTTININYCIEIKIGNSPEILLTNNEIICPNRKIAKEIESTIFVPQAKPIPPTS